MNVYFSHGKESGPWGTKINALAAIARQKGFRVESPDYSNQPDPDTRVEELLNLRLPDSEFTVLVGSSMGGYVATVASQIINPVGLFLMAPAFYLPEYNNQSPTPHARKTVIIHGLKDEVVSVENSIRFAREHSTELHLVDGDHSLIDQLPKIEILFGLFLDEILEIIKFSGVIAWDSVSNYCCRDDSWISQVWKCVVDTGSAEYRTEIEQRTILLRFVALEEFHHTFLSLYSIEEYEWDRDNVLADLDITHCLDAKKSIDDELREIAQTFAYPLILECFGGIDNVAMSIYWASSPNNYDAWSESEGMGDPEDEGLCVDKYVIVGDDYDLQEQPSRFDISMMEALRNITIWLEETLPVTFSVTSNPPEIASEEDFETRLRKHNEEYHARWDRIYKAEAEGVSAVGIFWVFPGMKLQYNSLPYTEGIYAGNYITAGVRHKSDWKSLKRLVQHMKGDLKELDYKYNHFPRGRVEYCKQTEKFIIYGPEIVINDGNTMELIKSTFRIADQVCDAVKLPSYEDYTV